MSNFSKSCSVPWFWRSGHSSEIPSRSNDIRCRAMSFKRHVYFVRARSYFRSNDRGSVIFNKCSLNGFIFTKKSQHFERHKTVKLQNSFWLLLLGFSSLLFSIHKNPICFGELFWYWRTHFWCCLFFVRRSLQSESCVILWRECLWSFWVAVLVV